MVNIDAINLDGGIETGFNVSYIQRSEPTLTTTPCHCTEVVDHSPWQGKTMIGSESMNITGTTRAQREYETNSFFLFYCLC